MAELYCGNSVTKIQDKVCMPTCKKYIYIFSETFCTYAYFCYFMGWNWVAFSLAWFHNYIHPPASLEKEKQRWWQACLSKEVKQEWKSCWRTNVLSWTSHTSPWIYQLKGKHVNMQKTTQLTESREADIQISLNSKKKSVFLCIRWLILENRHTFLGDLLLRRVINT